MNPFDFVPKHKSDVSGIPQLARLRDEEIQPVIPHLLEWIQDMNWPVAQEVLNILAARQNLVESCLPGILRTEEKDSIWKYWIISELLPRFEKPLSEELLATLRRITQQPNQDEVLEEVDRMARKYLKCCGNC